MKKSLIGLLFALLFILHWKASGEDTKYDVPYVPSKTEIVMEMLKIANVCEDDVLYDLGCGDGRIVISAAEKIGAHGVGIDINPERIKESRENAEKAKVTDRVLFIQQDLFEANISEATVVMLYLLPEVNLRLRPKLFTRAKTGNTCCIA